MVVVEWLRRKEADRDLEKVDGLERKESYEEDEKDKMKPTKIRT